MKYIILLSLAFTLCLISYADAEPESFTFLETDYVHRWSEGNQHEFTPRDQEDLATWTDMVTVNRYPDAKSGDNLANIANNLLGVYQEHGANILRTDSKPRTEEKEAEHLIAVAFSQPEFVEIAFARLAMEDGKAYSIVYSHRIYGENAVEEANRWIPIHGQESETALMAMPLRGAAVSMDKPSAATD